MKIQGSNNIEAIYESLAEKVKHEFEEFKEAHLKLSAKENFEDWYKIGFFASYNDMLTSDYIDSGSADDEIAWLNGFDCPLSFLYDKWLSCDGALSYSWDEMLNWIRELYRELVIEKESV